MKKLVTILALFAIFLAYTNITAQAKDPQPPAKHGKGFVDKNGDGYNDNAPDDDGDGIPNGLDPDYTGPKFQKNKFVDLDGDGINDNAGKGKRGRKSVKGGYGPADGTGKNGVAPQNGTGNGTQGTGGRGFKGGKK